MLAPNRPRSVNVDAALLLSVVALGLFGLRLYVLPGLVRPVLIDGGSMVPSFVGERFSLVCPRCQWNWEVDAEAWQQTSVTYCSRCAATVDHHASSNSMEADRVLVDRSAYWFRKPQRYEVVAARVGSDIAIKRIVALPGERWEIRGGELLLDGQLWRKSLAQFHETCVLVHRDDSGSRPSEFGWTAKTESRWQRSELGWIWQGRGEAAATSDSLTYAHRAPHPAAQAPSPVQDYDPYNPSLARPLHPVTDLVVSGRLKITGDAEIHFRIHDGYAWRQIKLDRPEGMDERQAFEFGLIDRRLFLRMDGSEMESRELSDVPTPPNCLARPLEISGAGEGTLELLDLTIRRDIHFLSPSGEKDSWTPPWPANDGYIALGDNQPLSIDCRHWETSIPPRDILGKILPWKQSREWSSGHQPRHGNFEPR